MSYHEAISGLQHKASAAVKDVHQFQGESSHLGYKTDTRGTNSFVIKNQGLRGEGAVNPYSKELRGQTYGGSVGGGG